MSNWPSCARLGGRTTSPGSAGPSASFSITSAKNKTTAAGPRDIGSRKRITRWAKACMRADPRRVRKRRSRISRRPATRSKSWRPRRKRIRARCRARRRISPWRSNWATCYRELGEYQKALDAFSEVLAEQESQLTVQQAAARTYQRWGEAGGGVKKLERAIYGGYQIACDRQEPHLGLAQAGAGRRASGAVRSKI